MGSIQRKYNTATTVLFPLIDRGTEDFESSPVVHASGDTQISKDVRMLLGILRLVLRQKHRSP